jgi:hypothetical protein
MRGEGSSYELAGKCGIRVEWRLGDGALLMLAANLSGAPVEMAAGDGGRDIWVDGEIVDGRFGPWTVTFRLAAPAGGER